MSTPAPAASKPRWIGQVLLCLVVAALTFGVMLLWQSIVERKQEAKQVAFKVVDVTEDTIDPEVWGKNFPRQYDTYRRTVDIVRTKHGGSEAFQKLDEFPSWRLLWKGYAFGIDFREERGHAYMLSDQGETERVKQFKQPGACLHCHASTLPAFRELGVKAGVPNDEAHRQEAIMKGFEKMCGMPYAEARQLVGHPVSCVDCHHPETMALRVTRPGFINGMQALAQSSDPVPHLPSVERWRKGNRKTPYDPNAEASRQEMRSLACGQCHVEYYFKGEGKLLTYPWHKGLKAEQIEEYYDAVGWKDWTHADTGSLLLKAQHPEFELWSQGIHARSGVACADCHMPYMRDGAIKVSDHHIRSPLLNIARACQTCHHYPEDEILARATLIQDRTKALRLRAEDATVDLVKYLTRAKQGGATDEQLKESRQLHRKAQWRLDYVYAENSGGFHASQESARILAEAMDYARQGQVKVLELGKPAAGK